MNDKQLWDFSDDANLLIDYSEQENYQFNIDDYSAKIIFPTNLILEMSHAHAKHGASKLIKVEYINTDLNKEVNISASNLSFADIDLIMVIENSSSLLTPYILIIALLIIVYVVFLRYVFVG